MEKKVFYMELAYILGLISLAFGTALMEKANFGLSMVVAPAYLVYLKVSQFIPGFTFGMAEYTFQALLLIFMVVILRKFRAAYLFSFVTAVIYGVLLDLAIQIVSYMPLPDTFIKQTALQVLFFIIGMIVCALGVSLLFHTYIAPEVYELFVKEVSQTVNLPMHRFKMIYDCSSCLIGIIMSFAFFGFGNFQGIKAGTIICALLNGWLIGIFTKFLERHWNFRYGIKMNDSNNV